MSEVVLVLGTATDVGKTWVAARVAEGLRQRGLRVAARKPVQSFDPADEAPRDADVLAAATGEPPDAVCSPARTLARPLAPPIAAAELGLPELRIDDLIAGMAPWSPEIDVVVVEGVGGVRSPVAVDGDNVTVADVLRPGVVVVVAGAGLGAINDVVLATDALDAHRPRVLLNRFDHHDRTHVLNLRWLRDRGLPVDTEVAAVTRAIAVAARSSSTLPAEPVTEDA